MSSDFQLTHPGLHEGRRIPLPLQLDDDLRDAVPTAWKNPHLQSAADAMLNSGLSPEGVNEARARLRRFAPLIEELFPETAQTGGILESPLRVLHRQLLPDRLLSGRGDQRLLIKLDSELPLSGSVKARGGVHEVLVFAERIALETKLITPESDYRVLATAAAKTLFGNYRIAVGSTGNLGLAIGVMAAALGFETIVHMSVDARTWKKQLLRQAGVTVVEHSGDYSDAIDAGREEAAGAPRTHFIDDERSTSLFYGYSAAAHRLAGQLQALEIAVDHDHPLVVILPCGVGGAPGGITFGLKRVFGDAAHSVFVEPTQAPCMLLGVASGRYESVQVSDIGLTGRTAADGLAVGRPSALVSRSVSSMIDGFITVDDDDLYRSTSRLYDAESLFIEPSAASGLAALPHVADGLHLSKRELERATFLLWATGGGLVPQREREDVLNEGRRLRDAEARTLGA